MNTELKVQNLKQQLFNRNIKVPCFFYETIDSTNLEAFRLLESHPHKCVIVISKVQTAGRGTHGRVWQDNHGQISLTIGFRETVSPESLGFFRIQANQALRDKLESLWPQGWTLKAPNDILWHGKKLSGLLIESKIEKGLTSTWVIGYGINVSGEKHLWTKEVQDLAITLQDVVQTAIDYNVLAAELIESLLQAHEKQLRNQ